MKLISEQVEHISVITEAKEGGGKSYFIEGPFLQAEVVNKNGRRYPMETMEREVTRYMNENVKTNRAYGELGHPSGPSINLERVSHMIKELHFEGNDVIGRAKIMDTPYGMIVQNLMSEGAQLGVSSRGMGSLVEKNGIKEVQDDYYLATAADIVADPSGPSCYVTGIMENVDWVFDARNGWRAQEVAEQQKNVIKKARHITEAQKLDMFKRFLGSI